ncbi:MAG: hypothetical protein IPJ40_02970 [Saprospirales bacterium]|nr:hypothetical protein [Saprospirales bacterium]
MRLDVVQDYYKLAAPYIYNAPDAQGKADSNQPVSFSLRPGVKISSLSYYPSLGPLVSLENGTVKYWPEGRKENEESIDVKAYLEEWYQGNVDSSDYNKLNAGFSADGNNIQVQMRYELQPLYEMAGNLVPAPSLTISVRSYWQEDYGDYYAEEEAYYQEDDAHYEEEDQVTNDAFSIGTYDLFTGKFLDEFGLSYSQDEFMRVYGDPDLLVNGTTISVSNLFSSEYKLIDVERGIFLDSVYQDLKGVGMVINNGMVLDSIIQLSQAGKPEGREVEIPCGRPKASFEAITTPAWFGIPSHSVVTLSQGFTMNTPRLFSCTHQRFLFDSKPRWRNNDPGCRWVPISSSFGFGFGFARHWAESG